MNGKIVGGVIWLQQPLQSVALYYLQVYGYITRSTRRNEGVCSVSINSTQSEKPDPDAITFRAHRRRQLSHH